MSNDVRFRYELVRLTTESDRGLQSQLNIIHPVWSLDWSCNNSKEYSFGWVSGTDNSLNATLIHCVGIPEGFCFEGVCVLCGRGLLWKGRGFQSTLLCSSFSVVIALREESEKTNRVCSLANPTFSLTCNSHFLSIQQQS